MINLIFLHVVSFHQHYVLITIRVILITNIVTVSPTYVKLCNYSKTIALAAINTTTCSFICKSCDTLSSYNVSNS